MRVRLLQAGSTGSARGGGAAMTACWRPTMTGGRTLSGAYIGGHPELCCLCMNERYMLDMHGYFDVASASYRDALQADSRAGRGLSEIEFLLGASYALWRVLLELKARGGLGAEEAEARAYLRAALPEPYPVPLELAEYLSHLGPFTTVNGVRLSPDFVLPRRGGPGAAGTTEPVGSWSSTHQPLLHSLALARLSANAVGAPGAASAAAAAADPFTNVDRVSTIPGSCLATGGPGAGPRRSLGATARWSAPLSRPGSRCTPSWSRTMSGGCGPRRRRGAPRARPSRATAARRSWCCRSPVDYSDGRREAGSDYVTGCMLPHAAAQAGRLFRFQRMTPVELTYSGLAADENWAYERSSRFAKLRSVSARRVGALQAVCTQYAAQCRKPCGGLDGFLSGDSD